VAAVAGEPWRAELARHHWVDTYLGPTASVAFLEAEVGAMREALAALGLLAGTA
jgi:tripartite-type tricarboxylate transporter receptor subunit TctC